MPFNIDVEYKWDATDMMPSIDKQLVPVDEELVIPFMQVMYDVWFSPYEQTAGLDFVKEITPKKVVLVGSPEYEFGAIKLGQAEGGRKILLLNVNGFDPSDAANVKEFLHTIEHEFAHILHQTVLFDKNYEKISAGNYLPSGWTSVSDSEARQLGFITPYAMSGKDEDFVEMISMIMVYGREWYEETVLTEAGTTRRGPVAAEGADRDRLPEKHLGHRVLRHGGRKRTGDLRTGGHRPGGRGQSITL